MISCALICCFNKLTQWVSIILKTKIVIVTKGNTLASGLLRLGKWCGYCKIKNAYPFQGLNIVLLTQVRSKLNIAQKVSITQPQNKTTWAWFPWNKPLSTQSNPFLHKLKNCIYNHTIGAMLCIYLIANLTILSGAPKYIQNCTSSLLFWIRFPLFRTFSRQATKVTRITQLSAKVTVLLQIICFIVWTAFCSNWFAVSSNIMLQKFSFCQIISRIGLWPDMVI